jgi:N-acetylglucosaminyldiphosphoundecaprenol N-acetyl-beta-D-mannosaminyltransferase
MIDLQREIIWNVRVQTAQLSDILNSIDDGIASGVKGRMLFCANPHSLVAANDDSKFLAALHAADYLIPDGAGIVLASKILNGTIARRITGFDIFSGLAERWEKEGGKSYYFLGSSEKVLEKIKTRMLRDYPHVSVAGTCAPPFKEEFSDEENSRMIDQINAAAPTALWVGMTAPKQEKWIHEHRDRLKVPFIAAIGAAFDFFAGTRRRASTPLQNAGLEWLPRLLREPRRMWRRNFVSSPVFLYYVLRQKMGLQSSNAPHDSQQM